MSSLSFRFLSEIIKLEQQQNIKIDEEFIHTQELQNRQFRFSVIHQAKEKGAKMQLLGKEDNSHYDEKRKYFDRQLFSFICRSGVKKSYLGLERWCKP